ncbi:MAG: hypothetical protein IAG10_33145 [Planctomycetaceae bacterium]|nr:hypothetical protein [Planctomycetaceae bacterium]
MGQLRAVELLLSIGADLDHRDERGMSAWMIADEKGEDETVRLLKSAEQEKRDRENTEREMGMRLFDSGRHEHDQR